MPSDAKPLNLRGGAIIQIVDSAGSPVARITVKDNAPQNAKFIGCYGENVVEKGLLTHMNYEAEVVLGNHRRIDFVIYDKDGLTKAGVEVKNLSSPSADIRQFKEFIDGLAEVCQPSGDYKGTLLVVTPNGDLAEAYTPKALAEGLAYAADKGFNVKGISLGECESAGLEADPARNLVIQYDDKCGVCAIEAAQQLRAAMDQYDVHPFEVEIAADPRYSDLQASLTNQIDAVTQPISVDVSCVYLEPPPDSAFASAYLVEESAGAFDKVAPTFDTAPDFTSS